MERGRTGPGPRGQPAHRARPRPGRGDRGSAARANASTRGASDLGRALQTAAAIGARSALEVRPDPRLRERSFGEGEGLGYDEIDRRWPDVFTRSGPTDPDRAIPGGESRREFHERVRAAFSALAREHAGKRVAVVSHGGVVAALYRIVHDIPVAHAHRIAISNASYNAVAFDGDAWALEAWGKRDLHDVRPCGE